MKDENTGECIKEGDVCKPCTEEIKKLKTDKATESVATLSNAEKDNEAATALINEKK